MGEEDEDWTDTQFFPFLKWLLVNLFQISSFVTLWKSAAEDETGIALPQDADIWLLFILLVFNELFRGERLVKRVKRCSSISTRFKAFFAVVESAKITFAALAGMLIAAQKEEVGDDVEAFLALGSVYFLASLSDPYFESLLNGIESSEKK